MADTDPSLSPEKRLLKLIEGESSAEDMPKLRPSAPPWNPADLMGKVAGLLSPAQWKNVLPAARAGLGTLLANRGQMLRLGDINRIAKLATVGLGVYLLLSFVYEIKVVNANYLGNLTPPKRRESAEFQMTERKIFDTDLLEEAESIKVFVPLAVRGTERAATEAKPDHSLKLVELTKDFKLAGISISPTKPEASYCMIEDIKKSVTTFLRKGDTVSGLKVVEITPESIVLGLDDETVELR